MCQFFGVSRQAYYKGLKEVERKSMEEELILELVQQIRWKHRHMGGKKLYKLLEEDIHRINADIGRDKFFDLLRKWKLLVIRRRKYAITTQSFHRFKVYKNELAGFKTLPCTPSLGL